MNQAKNLWSSLVVFALLLVALGGCVERVMKIETDPQGALITVNDEEVGVSPVKFSFLWYGDYDIIARKSGYRTLKTHYRVNPPWYQYPPIDLVAETLLPVTIRDEHVVPVLQLEPAEAPTVEEVIRRAGELRRQALSE
jgi:hypothetical protein